MKLPGKAACRAPLSSEVLNTASGAAWSGLWRSLWSHLTFLLPLLSGHSLAWFSIRVLNLPRSVPTLDFELLPLPPSSVNF